MFRKLFIYLGLIRPFTHNPKDFELKIVQSWFSSDYVNLKFTANGGFDWEYIYHCRSPFLGHIDYNYTWEKLSYDLVDTNFERIKDKFSSYQKILDFTKLEDTEWVEGNKKLNRQREEIEQRKADKLKQINIKYNK